MSFTGDLEHLPIVDILQLLHATRKSGILRVTSRKGESHLVFKNGYIVSANHLNNSIRIGDILIKRNAITPAMLERTLQQQQAAGEGRKPLIVMLLDMGAVKEEEAYRGLEELIEITVVEILTWKKGTFVLDMLSGPVPNVYRYYPAAIDHEINVDTQGVLMDSLRIFDERRRDGELPEESPAEDEARAESSPEGGEPLLSADDLGLGDLDQLERKIPEVYSGLADPTMVHRRKLDATAAALSPEQRDELAAFLAEFSTGEEGNAEAARASSLLFYSPDEALQHEVTTVCKQAGIPVFATNDEQNLEPIIYRSLEKNRLPLLVFDAPYPTGGSFSAENMAALRRQQREDQPEISIIQLAPPRDDSFAMQAYGDGVRAVIPGPPREASAETFVADTIRFLLTFQAYARRCATERDSLRSDSIRRCIAALREAREVPGVALILLQGVAGTFERAVTLIVRETELVAERGIGIKDTQGRGATPPLGFRIPLTGSSLLRRVIDSGRILFGKADDAALRDHLFAKIGMPRRASLLLLPLRLRGKTIALTYGDFGDREITPVDINLLYIMANQAELALEIAAGRKKLDKSPVKG